MSKFLFNCIKCGSTSVFMTSIKRRAESDTQMTLLCFTCGQCNTKMVYEIKGVVQT